MATSKGDGRSGAHDEDLHDVHHGTSDDGGLDVGEATDLRLSLAVAAFRAADRAEVELLGQLVGIVERQSFRRDGAVSFTGWVRRMLGVDVAEARRINRLVRLLVRLPGLLGALQSGVTSLRHVDVLERTVTTGREAFLDRFADQLVGFASSLGIDDFQVVCVRWAEYVDQEVKPCEVLGGRLSVTSTLFGEADVRGRLSADQALPVLAALELLVRPDPRGAPVRLSRGEKTADAFADLAQCFLDGDTPSTLDADADVSRDADAGGTETNRTDAGGVDAGGVDAGRAETGTADTGEGGSGARCGSVCASAGGASRRRRARAVTTVVLDLDTLLNRNLELWEGTGRQQPVLDLVRRSNAVGAPLPSVVAGLLGCDASVRRLVVDGKGRPLDVGRTVRTATPAQREALVFRDSGCVFPTCDRPAQFCDAHHIVPWEEGGRSDLDNLLFLCRHHHRLVHGDVWSIERDPVTGIVTAVRRDGWRQSIYRRDESGTVEVESAWRVDQIAAAEVGAGPPS